MEIKNQKLVENVSAACQAGIGDNNATPMLPLRLLWAPTDSPHTRDSTSRHTHWLATHFNYAATYTSLLSRYNEHYLGKKSIMNLVTLEDKIKKPLFYQHLLPYALYHRGYKVLIKYGSHSQQTYFLYWNFYDFPVTCLDLSRNCHDCVPKLRSQIADLSKPIKLCT